MTRQPITPLMKVGELLTVYPELEAVLISIAPEFEKLKNPILRRTVARVATLAQAAKIGRIDARILVNRLREAAGHPTTGDAEIGDEAPVDEDTSRPSWIDSTDCVATFDADALLAASQHPIAAIQPCLVALKPGERLEIRATFDPVPLVDAASERGLLVHTERFNGGATLTHIASAKQDH